MGIVDFMVYTNTLIDGWLGPGMLIMIFFVSFLATKGFTSDRAFGFASFMTLIAAIFLRFLELVNDIALYTAGVIFIAAIIFLQSSRSAEVGV